MIDALSSIEITDADIEEIERLFGDVKFDDERRQILKHMEITVAEFLKTDGKERLVVDMRSEFERNYGFIPLSVYMSEEEILGGEFDEGKEIVICCARGLRVARVSLYFFYRIWR